MAVEIVLIITFLYAFAGPLAFFAYLFGLLLAIFKFPLAVIGYFYPVGPLPQIFLYGIPAFLIGLYLLKLIKTH